MSTIRIMGKWLPKSAVVRTKMLRRINKRMTTPVVDTTYVPVNHVDPRVPGVKHGRSPLADGPPINGGSAPIKPVVRYPPGNNKPVEAWWLP